jgi:DNA-binding transcriptional regulator YiaG
MAQALPVLLMLERWIEPVVRHMGPEFTTHDYIEKLRELYPADYAHDLALCTLGYGFPQSLGVLHKAIATHLRALDCVETIGNKESRDIRGNKHRALVWRRLDNRRPSERPREPVRSKAKQRLRPPTRQTQMSPSITGAELRAARTALGWTQTELARRAGVSLAAVSLWERDKRRMMWPTYEAVQSALQAGHSAVRQ